MSRSPRRLLPPTAGRTGVAKLDLQQFSRRLYEKMMAQNLSQSDLARRVWGTTEDANGYTVAKGRDRISQYLSGKSFPDPKNLKKLASALACTEDDLAPDATAAAIDRENPEIAMTAIAGHTDKVHLQVNKLVPLTLASKIIQMLTEEEAKK